MPSGKSARHDRNSAAAVKTPRRRGLQTFRHTEADGHGW